MDEQEKVSFKLPIEWIDRIFKRFDEIYGSRFINRFSNDTDFDMERIRWQGGLYGVTPEEIRKVLDMCRTSLVRDPPNVFEFFNYCKGNSQPILRKSQPFPSAANQEIAQQYLKLIRDKLHGRNGSEGEATLSALNQQILDNKIKQENKSTHWQEN